MLQENEPLQNGENIFKLFAKMKSSQKFVKLKNRNQVLLSIYSLNRLYGIICLYMFIFESLTAHPITEGSPYLKVQTHGNKHNLFYSRCNMGLDVRKAVFGGLRTTKVQTSLRIRAD